jgi:serine/threonine protein kinase/Tfp pilus assembly protein PilF
MATIADGGGVVRAASDPATPSSNSSDAMMTVEIGPDSPTLAGGALRSAPAGEFTADGFLVFQPGTVLGNRYEILQVLGRGGMGAVYKARDREVNRVVALKVIRPDLAGNSSIIERFKQELILSREVTHKNVVRIYDLGDADGVKFITMEFVEGNDLRSVILEKKKFSPSEAVEIMLQICRALEAAHTVGVIHRDLKPQNIMRDNQGRIVVMDFGLARLVESNGMTQTGALVGTMEYMSPEQALGSTLDQRSDLFTLGLIFYELLTGKMPFAADSALASLIKRTQERAIPVTQHDSSIPASLAAIVSKCMERDPKLRYQSATDLVNDLEAWQGKRAAASLQFPASQQPWGQTIPWHWIGGAVAVLVLMVVAFLLRNQVSSSKSSTPAAGPVVSLAILPLRNASGDSSLDWLGSSMAEMLSTDIGQSAQLRTVSENRLHQIFSDLRITPQSEVDSGTLHRVAEFSNADRVVWGQFAKFGDQIRIDATLQDLKTDRTTPLKIDIASEKEIPAAIDRLADSVRQKLALSDNVLKELKASSFKPSSQSLEAMRDYDQGLNFQRDGKYVEAQQQFDAATKADPNFALAFSKLAQSYSALGYDAEAEQAAQKAVSLSDALPQAEKYLISAIQAQISGNSAAAIQQYENLAKASPDNTDVEQVLAGLYEESGTLAKAEEFNRKILASNPNDIQALLALARVTMKQGNPQASFDPLNHALSLSAQLDNQEQRAAALQLTGAVYRVLDKPEEALRNYREALAIRRNLGQKKGIAQTLNESAKVQAALGQDKAALASFQEGMQIRRDIGDRRGLGDSLIDLGNFYDSHGNHDQALGMYKESLQIQRDLQNEVMQAACLNDIGSVYFEKGQFEDALTYFQQALQLREKFNVPGDTIDALHNIAETSVRMGQYDQAIAQYMRALDLCRKIDDRRGAAMESFSLGDLFENQGRFGAALSSKQDALKTFVDLKDKSNWMASISGGYGDSLVLAGRGDEASPYIQNALGLSRELKNDGILAETLGFQGDQFFYKGDYKSAEASYQQALQAATRAKESETVLKMKIQLAEVAAEQGRSAEAISMLRPLVQAADGQGLVNSSLAASIYLAEALLAKHDNAHARQELDRAQARADKVGLKALSARAHYLLAKLLVASGSQADAQQQYRAAAQLIDSMKSESGSDKILQRADFKQIYGEASRQK